MSSDSVLTCAQLLVAVIKQTPLTLALLEAARVIVLSADYLIEYDKKPPPIHETVYHLLNSLKIFRAKLTFDSCGYTIQ